ncbi:MAG: DUF547 domain-containing protein [Candidatus Omnitrophica bacterium]|nr:DUF547 domain-containing protein [Candidatus Omnitrophota bacterium]
MKKAVNETGEVDYLKAKEESALLQVYFRKLRKIPAQPSWGWPREEKIAVLINGYNAGVIKLILDHGPVKSVNNIAGFWDFPIVPVGRNSYSLNQVQDDLLLRQFREEKVIFALTSGTRSSPALRREAYTGPKLEGQLYLAVRDFVNARPENQIELGGKKVTLSRLFKWQARHFLMNWGDSPGEGSWDPLERATLSFIAHFLEDPKKVEYLREGGYRVKYTPYDWQLNKTSKT